MTLLLRRKWPDLDEIGSLVRNSTPITLIMVEVATGEKFQYGGRLFFQAVSSYILAVN